MAFDAEAGRTPNPIDVAVGRRMRDRRKTLGMSQEALAAALGITFQQIQKYESGANRISASKLYAAARTLQTPVQSFFFGLPDPVADPDAAIEVEPAGQALIDTQAGARLARAALALPQDLLVKLANIAEAIADAVATQQPKADAQ
ncbi:XRE family transcriptional regulator [Caulobacter vibrioides]|uniref:XRE family transcriptional regulator n=1 Tax=Caulobacter vibrioides TaxID=155892 RepID=A0A290MQN9_CAUVI|nr:helix-turn-helix transcriptional regulator [Caulobacter vibrioides]ATC34085.1 XRE family transcriptional regulator [Caulobacter vibrioides]